MKKHTAFSTYNLTTSVALIAILLVMACKKNNSEDLTQTGETTAIPIQRINDCHTISNPYPSQITSNIVGDWLWEKSYAPMAQKTTTASKHLVVQFGDASTYEIFEDGISVASGVWKLNKFSDTEWAIELNNTNTHVKGNISLCNNELLLSTAYVDGAINYFVRK